MKKLFHISILTTHKFKDRQRSILNTWLRNFNDYVFYTDKVTDLGNQISVCDDDSYNSAAIKQVNEINRIKYSNLIDEYDWFFFCDDDTVVNINLLEQFCQNKSNIELCYGKVGDTWPNLNYFSGGAGFLLKSDLIKSLPKMNFISGANFSDVQVGLWLKSNGVKLTHHSRFNSHDPSFCGKQDEINNQITFHYIKTFDQMNYINEKFKN